MNRKTRCLSRFCLQFSRLHRRENFSASACLNLKMNRRTLTPRRVVVTGMGLITCLGVGKQHVWEKLLNGDCGITSITEEEYEKLPCKVAGFVPQGLEAGQLDLRQHLSSSELRTMSQGSAYALVATEEAFRDAGWRPETNQDKLRTGVAIGMGLVGMLEILKTGISLKEIGYSRVNPYFMPKILINMSAGNVSVKYGLQGPNHAVSTACTTGLHAIGDAYRFIQRGEADIMVAGGAEESPNPLSIAGFSRMRALCTKYNHAPTESSRPFDKDRDGFVMSEGAGILILEELGHALDRGANIQAEILGYGLSGDGHHITAPREDGDGAFLCMQAAMKDAGIKTSDVQYVNAHATSTPLGDLAESRAIFKMFEEQSDHLLVSSTKGATGHLLGAAGCVEAIFTLLACKSGRIPPTLNLHNIDTGVPLNYVPFKSVDWISGSDRRIALTNSFGFGGTNGCLCVASYP